MPGYEVFAGMILTIYYFSANRVTILMNVGGAHKYRDLQPFIFKIFFVKNFFYDNDFPIGRANDPGGFFSKFAGWDPEKGDQEKEDTKGQHENNSGKP